MQHISRSDCTLTMEKVLILASVQHTGYTMIKRISAITIIDIIIYGIIIGFIAYAKTESLKGAEAFAMVIREDGWVEYLTTLFLVLGAILLGRNALRAAKIRDGKKIVFFTLAMLFFIFGAGEEISWGHAARLHCRSCCTLPEKPELMSGPISC